MIYFCFILNISVVILERYFTSNSLSLCNFKLLNSLYRTGSNEDGWKIECQLEQ